MADNPPSTGTVFLWVLVGLIVIVFIILFIWAIVHYASKIGSGKEPDARDVQY